MSDPFEAAGVLGRPIGGSTGRRVLDIVAETTAQVIGHRRLALLSRLISQVVDPDEPRDLVDRALTVVRSGHDRHSAAAMAQVRNLTRGVAYTLQQPPSRVLSSLDAAMSGLAVNALATAILARFDRNATDAGHGRYGLRWSNAGHPPPLLLHADGVVEVLQTRPEPLLGMRAAPARTDHAVTLEPGSTVVFYTDGLVERRSTTLDEGIAELTALLGGRRSRTAEEICDLLLEHFGYNTEDDIVLAVVHVHADRSGVRAVPDAGNRPA